MGRNFNRNGETLGVTVSISPSVFDDFAFRPIRSDGIWPCLPHSLFVTPWINNCSDPLWSVIICPSCRLVRDAIRGFKSTAVFHCFFIFPQSHQSMVRANFLSTGRDRIPFQAMQYRLSADPSVRGAIQLSVQPTRIRIPFHTALTVRWSVG